MTSPRGDIYLHIHVYSNKTEVLTTLRVLLVIDHLVFTALT